VQVPVEQVLMTHLGGLSVEYVHVCLMITIR
jgi:hypothetical protein